jgi:hypothetical protein
MSEQPEALRLADRLQCNVSRGIHWDAAAELRRLHAVNQELLVLFRLLPAEVGLAQRHQCGPSSHYQSGGKDMSEEDEGLFDDVPLANRERDRAFEAFIKRKDVKAMFSDPFPFPLNRGYYDFWCIVWAKAWDKGFKIGWEERGKWEKEKPNE